jgi:hypothetical protein
MHLERDTRSEIRCHLLALHSMSRISLAVCKTCRSSTFFAATRSQKPTGKHGAVLLLLQMRTSRPGEESLPCSCDLYKNRREVLRVLHSPLRHVELWSRSCAVSVTLNVYITTPHCNSASFLGAIPRSALQVEHFFFLYRAVTLLAGDRPAERGRF